MALSRRGQVDYRLQHHEELLGLGHGMVRAGPLTFIVHHNTMLNAEYAALGWNRQGDLSGSLIAGALNSRCRT
jgi:hypothetical protein